MLHLWQVFFDLGDAPATRYFDIFAPKMFRNFVCQSNVGVYILIIPFLGFCPQIPNVEWNPWLWGIPNPGPNGARLLKHQVNQRRLGGGQVMKYCFVGGVQPPQKGKERTVFPVACFWRLMIPFSHLVRYVSSLDGLVLLFRCFNMHCPSTLLNITIAYRAPYFNPIACCTSCAKFFHSGIYFFFAFSSIRLCSVTHVVIILNVVSPFFPETPYTRSVISFKHSTGFLALNLLPYLLCELYIVQMPFL